KPKRNEALEYYRRIVSSNDLNIHLFEKVNSIEKTGNIFLVSTEKDSYSAHNIILATGFYDLPNTLNIPGEELDKVFHYYKDPHFFSQQKVAVIGASNSAIDAALECYRKGADVTLIIRGPEVGTRVKYWVRPDILNRIEEGSIKAYYNTTVTEITEGKIQITSPEETKSLKNDYVLALTGYMPNFDFLEKMGVQLSEDQKRIPQYDPETMETNVEGIYLAGVICGGMETHKWFIENSRIHAPMIIGDIKQKIDSVK